MYAVIRTGGKQLRVEPGQAVRIEKIEGDVGAEVTLPDVLLVGEEGSVKIGQPLVEGARVQGTITAQARHPKVRMFKIKRRKGYRRSQSHRQSYTEVRIDAIQG